VQLNKLKGKSNVVDNCNNTGNPVAARICKQLHDGRLYSYPAGACRYHNTGQSHSGTERESIVISGISEAKSTITRIECFPSWGTHHGIPAKAGSRFGGAIYRIALKSFTSCPAAAK